MKTVSEKLDERQRELDATRKILKIYQDLFEKVDRWNNVRLCSKNIIGNCDEVLISHICGCCADAPLYAWPYKEIDGIKVYSESKFIIGESVAYGSGEEPYDSWKDEMKEGGCNEIVIDKVQKMFDENPVVCYDEDEED